MTILTRCIRALELERTERLAELAGLHWAIENYGGQNA